MQLDLKRTGSKLFVGILHDSHRPKSKGMEAKSLGDDKPAFITQDWQDLIQSTPPDKSLLNWVQSPTEAEYIISHLTVENQIVLDPFMGTSVFGLAALKLNRKFIGIEIEEDTFNIAKSRIAEFLSLSPSLQSTTDARGEHYILDDYRDR